MEFSRRDFIQSSIATAAFPIAVSYPARADAWFWFVARALVSFGGRTVGRSTARAAMRAGARASRPVAKRSGKYATRMKPHYQQSQKGESYPFAEFVGKELGQYGAESTFDYVYRLNEHHQGGTESTAVYNDKERDGGIGFSTGDRAERIADFHLSHVLALDICSAFLARARFTNAEMTGLLYPVRGQRSNFGPNGYALPGHISYGTAFGRVSMNSYARDRFRADVRVDDYVTGRHMNWDGIPI